MLLRFWWPETNDGEAPRPVVDCDRVNQDDLSLLGCLLADQGGGYWHDSLEWLRKGVAEVERVKRKEVDSTIWARDTFAVELREDRARIYSLYVEDYDDTLPLETFESALRAWLRFVEAGPAPGETREI